VAQISDARRASKAVGWDCRHRGPRDSHRIHCVSQKVVEGKDIIIHIVERYLIREVVRKQNVKKYVVSIQK
jgi:hypothetical protein